MFFYDAASVERAFGAHGLTAQEKLDEPLHNGSTFPFINVFCAKPR